MGNQKAEYTNDGITTHVTSEINDLGQAFQHGCAVFLDNGKILFVATYDVTYLLYWEASL